MGRKPESGSILPHLVFGYGHEHRPAVDPHGITLIAIWRDELPRHPCQRVGSEVEGFEGNEGWGKAARFQPWRAPKMQGTSRAARVRFLPLMPIAEGKDSAYDARCFGAITAQLEETTYELQH